ncbi:hypothetical protein TCAL_08892 [Tigriopus californicus]|uniref:CHK kinase-like domain-containing protein n=1 Tax=Tigriopus californicus TaxID=6832 RepID=A0A553NVF1_TIGCA|nr:hypothetical protein TCAL_08892 [Tigriopus californicus]|eukprot:TCALIF_08892-PA protein Name:"Protein of unknown function" AED:0.27 eAED:0.32 QI:0/0/0/0.5/1/1/2/0/794
MPIVGRLTAMALLTQRGGEEGPPWYLGNGDCCRFGDDVDGGLSDACTAQSRDRHKEDPVLPGTRTEIDVIRDWFLNIFQPVEKTADIEVIDFRFEAVRRKFRANVAGPRLSNPSSRSARAKEPTTSEPSAPSAPEASLALGKLMDDRGRLHRCDEFDLVFDDETLNGNNFRVLKKAEVDLKVNGKPKQYSVIIKVLPTDDPSRHCDRRKFYYLMKFGKEAQVYHDVIQCMAIYDEKRYPSACVEPPVPKCYLSQFDNQNDVMVLEDLEFSGYKKYDKGDHISDVDHCRVVLRRLAHFHAISTLIQRDSEMCLVDLFPFVIDAVAFRQRFRAQVANVRRQLLPYLNEMRKKKRDEKRNGSRNDKHEQLRGLLKEYGLSTATLDSRRPRLPNGTEDDPTSTDESQDKDRPPEELLERHFEDLFWKLVELRAPPGDRRLSVLVHGGLDLSNIVFQYDEASGRPICAKFLDFSTLTVSSPVIDITYFLHRSVQPGLARTHHATLLQHYHRAHTEAIKSFGMHGFELELETLLNEYQAKQDVGAMMGCLLKPAFFVLQNINAEKDKERENGGKNGAHLSSSASKSKSGPTNKSLPSGPGGPSESSLTTEDDDSHAQNGLTNGRSPRNLEQEDEPDEDDEEQDLDESLRIRPTIPTEVLKLDKSLVPIDLQLHQHLAQLTKECSCPCQYSGGDAQDTNGSGQPRNGDRGASNRLEECELTMAELSSDSLEDLHILARQQLKNSSGLKTFDCGGGTSGNPLKKLIRGLIPHSSHAKDQANNTTGASASESQPTKGKDEKKS